MLCTERILRMFVTEYRCRCACPGPPASGRKDGAGWPPLHCHPEFLGLCLLDSLVPRALRWRWGELFSSEGDLPLTPTTLKHCFSYLSQGRFVSLNISVFRQTLTSASFLFLDGRWRDNPRGRDGEGCGHLLKIARGKVTEKTN